MDKNSISPERKKLFILIIHCLFLLLSTTAIYWQVIGHEFITLDDPYYVSENVRIRQGLNLKSIHWAFTSYEAANWHPLTWLSLMLDYGFFGLNPAGYHLVNLLFHALSAVVLYLLLRRATKNSCCSLVVAMLFALHPIHVESVAWVSERKDVLSAFLGFMAIGAYILYAEKPGKIRYAAALLLFALGLLAKPMLVTIPCVLLLLDVWPLGRFIGKAPGADRSLHQLKKGSDSKTRKKPAPLKVNGDLPSYNFAQHKRAMVLVEKIPFFLLAAASSVMTVSAQSSLGAVKSLRVFYLHERIMNALVSYIQYIIKMFWPLNLAVYYPHPMDELPAWQVLGAAVLLIGMTAIAILAFKRLPFIAIGWFWYLGTLFPVIGIVQVGTQAMADRYAYIPFVGLYIIIAWGALHLVPERPWRKYLFSSVFILAAVGLMVMSSKQIGYWKDPFALYKHALKVTPKNAFMNFCLGGLFNKSRLPGEALQYFTQAVNDLPGEALRYFTQAVSDYPLYADAYDGAGQVSIQIGDYQNAIGYLNKALDINPSHISALQHMTHALQLTGRTQEAEGYYRNALAGDPENPQLHYEYGTFLATQNDFGKAAEHLLIAAKIDSNYVDPHIGLGIVWINSSDYVKAVESFNRALTITPENENAHYGMATALIRLGKTDAAIYHLREAIKHKPDYADAYNDLGSALFLNKKYDEAIACYQEALRLNPDFALAAENLKSAEEEARKARSQ